MSSKREVIDDLERSNEAIHKSILMNLDIIQDVSSCIQGGIYPARVDTIAEAGLSIALQLKLIDRQKAIIELLKKGKNDPMIILMD